MPRRKPIADELIESLSIAQRRALLDILVERFRQDRQWGEQNHDPFVWLGILMEEIGEFARAALEIEFGTPTSPRDAARWLANRRHEAVQVAAVAMAIVECIDRKQNESGGLRHA